MPKCYQYYSLYEYFIHKIKIKTKIVNLKRQLQIWIFVIKSTKTYDSNHFCNYVHKRMLWSKKVTEKKLLMKTYVQPIFRKQREVSHDLLTRVFIHLIVLLWAVYQHDIIKLKFCYSFLSSILKLFMLMADNGYHKHLKATQITMVYYLNQKWFLVWLSYI